MKTKITLLSLLFSISLISNAQDYVLDKRDKLEIEYSHKMEQWNDMSKFDLLQALEYAGISVYNFDLGEFDTDYNFKMFIDEVKDGKIIHTDTILNGNNAYLHHSTDHDLYRDFADQFKFFCKIKDTTVCFNIHTYWGVRSYQIEVDKYTEETFYKLIPYLNTPWKLNEKIPLLLYASSWREKGDKRHHLCGPYRLNEEERSTKEFIKNMPHYYKVSYLVKELSKRDSISLGF